MDGMGGRMVGWVGSIELAWMGGDADYDCMYEVYENILDGGMIRGTGWMDGWNYL